MNPFQSLSIVERLELAWLEISTGFSTVDLLHPKILFSLDSRETAIFLFSFYFSDYAVSCYLQLSFYITQLGISITQSLILNLIFFLR